jgi:transglutaminase-like putative cysteine protease
VTAVLRTAAPRRLRVVHRTGYRYAAPVVASYNEARMTPLTTPQQVTLEARVEVDPVTWTSTHWDYWGTQVTAFEVLEPHEELTVVSSSLVETYPPSPPPEPVGWDSLRGDAVLDTHHEFLTQTSWTQPPDEVVALARDAAGGLPPADAARAVCGELASLVTYVPGSTSVTSRAEDAWAHRKGVCQDFAHLTLGALRTLGVPARYVSGYLHPRPDAELGETLEGQGHAWVEWWAGDWTGFDTTHDEFAGEDHVLVARGRDYGDVPPLKGVYAGTSASQLFVSVEVTRLV